MTDLDNHDKTAAGGDGPLTEYQKGFMAGWDEAVRIFPALQSKGNLLPDPVHGYGGWGVHRSQALIRLTDPHNHVSAGSSILREDIAKTIWLAEYRRATGKERSITWYDVAEDDRLKYLFVADAIVGVIPTPAQSAGMRAALQAMLEALPTGVVLMWGNKPIDHTKLNYARSQAETALSQPSPAATVETVPDWKQDQAETSRLPRHHLDASKWPSKAAMEASHARLSAGTARQVRPELNLLTIGNTATADKSAGIGDAGCAAAVITPWATDDEPGRDFSLGLKSLSGLRTLTPEQSDFLHDAAEEFERLRDLPQAAVDREALEKLIQRHASAYVARGAAISDAIVAECKASREALLATLSLSRPAPQGARK